MDSGSARRRRLSGMTRKGGASTLPPAQFRQRRHRQRPIGPHAFKRGVRHRDLGQDEEEAVHWYAQAAEQGDALAQFNLGAMYVEGQGVARNFDKAMHWYRRAADQGNAPAQFSLGLLYEQSPGTLYLQEAVQWYRKAAEQGHAPAQVNLGALYAEGHGVRQDFQEALRWYQAAAADGYAPAQFNLGVMYAEGQAGILRDLAMAYVWFSRAAAQGDADARQFQQQLAAQLTTEQKTQVRQLLETS